MSTIASEHEKENDEQAIVTAHDDDESHATESIAEFESTWVSQTILQVHGIVDASLIQQICRYLDKHRRVWTDAAMLDDDASESDSEDEDVLSGAQDNQAGESHETRATLRSCNVTVETSTLLKFYSRIDPIVQATVDQFIQRFEHFSMVSTFDDYRCHEYTSNSYRAEAPEKTSLDSGGEGAMRTLVAIVLLTDSDGDFCFPLCNGETSDGLHLSGKSGDVFVFPACALHPYKIDTRESRTCLRFVHVNIA